MTKQYDERDAFDMDQGGGYYMRHVKAMNSEQLESKSDIAAELAWRDMQIDELQQKLDAANEKLSRYSMSAGQADQFAAEAKSVRKALGFAEDAQDVAPIDLLEKIAGLRAQGVDMYASHFNVNHTIVSAMVKATATEFAEQLRSGTHDSADKAG